MKFNQVEGRERLTFDYIVFGIMVDIQPTKEIIIEFFLSKRIIFLRGRKDNKTSTIVLQSP